jgi:putative membrane protein
MRLVLRPVRHGPVLDCVVFRKELFRVFFGLAAVAAGGFDVASEAGDGFPQRFFRVKARTREGDVYNALAAAVVQSAESVEFRAQKGVSCRPLRLSPVFVRVYGGFRLLSLPFGVRLKYRLSLLINCPMAVLPGIADLELGIPKSELGISKLELGISNLELEISNLDLGISKLELGISKLDLGISNLDLGISNLDLGISNLDLGISNLEIFCGVLHETEQKCIESGLRRPFSA